MRFRKRKSTHAASFPRRRRGGSTAALFSPVTPSESAVLARRPPPAVLPAMLPDDALDVGGVGAALPAIVCCSIASSCRRSLSALQSRHCDSSRRASIAPLPHRMALLAELHCDPARVDCTHSALPPAECFANRRLVTLVTTLPREWG